VALRDTIFATIHIAAHTVYHANGKEIGCMSAECGQLPFPIVSMREKTHTADSPKTIFTHATIRCGWMSQF
jgi:hypothetical protein